MPLISARRRDDFPPAALEISHPAVPVTDAIGDPAKKADAAERLITPFIPSVELKGGLAEKLRTLDTLIVYLEQLRRRLAGDSHHKAAQFDGPSRYASAPAWPWFSARATVTLAVMAMFLLAARGCA